MNTNVQDRDCIRGGVHRYSACSPMSVYMRIKYNVQIEHPLLMLAQRGLQIRKFFSPLEYHGRRTRSLLFRGNQCC